MTYSDLVAQWNRESGEAFTLSSLLPPVMPVRTSPSVTMYDPVSRACAEVQALGLALVSADPHEATEAGGTP